MHNFCSCTELLHAQMAIEAQSLLRVIFITCSWQEGSLRCKLVCNLSAVFLQGFNATAHRPGIRASVEVKSLLSPEIYCHLTSAIAFSAPQLSYALSQCCSGAVCAIFLLSH